VCVRAWLPDAKGLRPIPRHVCSACTRAADARQLGHAKTLPHRGAAALCRGRLCRPCRAAPSCSYPEHTQPIGWAALAARDAGCLVYMSATYISNPRCRGAPLGPTKSPVAATAGRRRQRRRRRRRRRRARGPPRRRTRQPAPLSSWQLDTTDGTSGIHSTTTGGLHPARGVRARPPVNAARSPQHGHPHCTRAATAGTPQLAHGTPRSTFCRLCPTDALSSSERAREGGQMKLYGAGGEAGSGSVAARRNRFAPPMCRADVSLR
jgi:hypothetical protein